MNNNAVSSLPAANRTPREEALAYAAAGYPVHPVRGKIPLTKWKDAASTDPATINAWYDRWPEAGVALITGERSGLFVVDLDVNKATGESTGEAAADRLGLSECFEGAPMARTGSGGRHVFFRAEEGLDNSAGKLGEGIDTRGTGGFVVAAGSPGYEWLGPSILDLDPPPVPAKLRAAIRARKSPAEAAPPAADRNVVELPFAALARQLAATRAAEPGGNAWAEQAIAAEVGRVAVAAAGARNHTLNRAAFALGQIVAGGGLERNRVVEALSRAARAIGLDEHEIGQTIASGLAAGAAEPRAAPERPQERVQALPQGPLFTPASALAGKPIAPRSWLVRDLVPDGTVTLLGGDGGTGKSLLALQLAVGTATGRAWLHRPIEKPGRALFLTAEDDLDEVHRRLADICTAEGLGLSDLGGLLIRSLAGEDALLAVLDRSTGALARTPLYDALAHAIAEIRPTAVFLDTLADLHSGEENNRAHARQFIGLLRALAIRHECAVVLLAHPSLSGMASGSGLSGSTAWNGSVRSRLYLDRVKQEGYEPDPDARKLTTKKANYGPTGDEIAIRWQAGVFVAEAAPTGLDRMAAGAKADRVYLRLLDAFNEQGRPLNPTSGSTFAPKVFAAHPESEGLTKRAFADAQERLFSSGEIVSEQFGKPSSPRTRIVRVRK